MKIDEQTSILASGLEYCMNDTALLCDDCPALAICEDRYIADQAADWLEAHGDTELLPGLRFCTQHTFCTQCPQLSACGERNILRRMAERIRQIAGQEADS